MNLPSTTQVQKATVILAGMIVVMALSGCSHSPMEDEGRIKYGRFTEFSGPELRVFPPPILGRERSVNTTDDAIDSRPGTTPIPGHQARDWTFVKDVEEGTSVAYALVSWDGDNPADYLVAGWWAEFPNQHYPDLSFADSRQYGLVDGPEIDISNPPVLPAHGRATYTGQAGGLYAYDPGSDWGEDEGTKIIDEYEGVITITADFAARTLSGCIGCIGDLITRRAHFGIFLGEDVRDLQPIAADYELHLGEATFNEDGSFEHTDVTVRHPKRTITQSSEGFWGGAQSNIPDRAGNPRLIAGFSLADFEESDGSIGRFVGAFVALSAPFQASEPSEPPS